METCLSGGHSCHKASMDNHSLPGSGFYGNRTKAYAARLSRWSIELFFFSLLKKRFIRQAVNNVAYD